MYDLDITSINTTLVDALRPRINRMKPNILLETDY